MSDAAGKRERPPVKDWLGVLLFDGRGTVRRLTNEEENAPYALPQKGFALVWGNSRAPEFHTWLRTELGDFVSDMIAAPTSRTRCVVMEDRAMITLRVPRPNASPDDIGRQILSLWLEKGRVIISSELNIPEFLGVSQWQQSHHAPLTPADLVARLGLRAADRLEPLIERLGDNLDSIEESLMAERTLENRARLTHLRRTLIGFRRLVWPQRDALNTLEIEDLSFFSPRDRLRLREASQRSARLGDELQALSERAVLVHEQILDTRAEQMNRIMLVLTAVTVILMPLTVISGILGMNVAGIPFANSPQAFWVVTGVLALLGGALFFLMRSRKWL